MSTVRTIAVLSAIATLILGLPVYPVAWLHATPEAAVNYDAGETAAWPTFARQVADVYHGFSPAEQGTAVLLTGNYGEAGALDHYGHRFGLPPVYSGHLAFWRWGPPPAARTGPVIVIGQGWQQSELQSACGSVTLAGKIDNGLNLDNDEQGASIWICRDLRRTWAELWPDLYDM